MTYVWLALGWFLALLFSLLTASMLLMKNWLQAALLVFVVLLVLPPMSAIAKNRWGLALHPATRILLVLGLLFAFGRLLAGGEQTSIYASQEVKARFMQLYDEKMLEWPVPHEDLFLATEYGKVHVIVSGPADGRPMMLLHASGVGSWSWKYNVEALSADYRTYAIDLLGDVGKSEFTSLKHILKNGDDQAELYANLADQLGIQKAYVVGASDGGFIGSNFARIHPERVEKMALLGPMGYAGVTRAVMRITFAQFFPLKPIQDNTFAWAFSDSAQLKEDYAEWFPLFMTGYRPARVSPFEFSAAQRQALKVPVMFVFGTRDNLVGNPEAARALVADVPNASVQIVEAGHLMGGEIPEQINRLLLEFFGTP